VVINNASAPATDEEITATTSIIFLLDCKHYILKLVVFLLVQGHQFSITLSSTTRRMRTPRTPQVPGHNGDTHHHNTAYGKYNLKDHLLT
jgi:hypothetical protein